MELPTKAEHSLRLRRDYTIRRLPGGESLADVHERAVRVAAELRARLHRGEALAAVAHYRSLQMLRGAIVGESLEAVLARRNYKPGNGSVLRMQFTTETGSTQLKSVGASDCTGQASSAMVAAPSNVLPCGDC
jgi:broad specificity phosphatase PhoE